MQYLNLGRGHVKSESQDFQRSPGEFVLRFPQSAGGLWEGCEGRGQGAALEHLRAAGGWGPGGQGRRPRQGFLQQRLPDTRLRGAAEAGLATPVPSHLRGVGASVITVETWGQRQRLLHVQCLARDSHSPPTIPA